MGTVLASAAYTYPEMLPFIYLLAGVFILGRIFSMKLPVSKILSASLVTGTSTFVILLPYLSTATSFLQNQIRAVDPTGTVLPGQALWPELVSTTYRWIAFWGMGGGIFDGGFYAFRTAVAVLLYALLIYGCYLLIKTREWALFAAIMIFAVAMLFFDFYRGYAYGTFKLLVLFWWLIAYVVIIAFQNIVDLNPQSQKKAYIAAATGYAAYFFSVAILATHSGPVLPFNSIEPFRELENLPIPSGRSVAAILTNDYNNIWAAYYLRNRDIFLYPMGGYMIWYVSPSDTEVRQADLRNTKFLLTDSRVYNPPGTRVWHNSEYFLFKLPDTWAYVFDIKAPNGLETRKKKWFLGLGNDPAEIKIASDFEGYARVTFNAVLGPSLPNVPVRQLLISSSHETNSITIATGRVNFSTYLRKGTENIVKLQVLDPPTLLIQPNGDGRIMLLEVSDLAINRHP
jgi:hypothetical protein